MKLAKTELLLACAAIALVSCTPGIEDRLRGLPSQHDRDGSVDDGSVDGSVHDGGSGSVDDGGSGSADGGSGDGGGPIDAGDYCELFECSCDSDADCTGVNEACVTNDGRACDCAPGFSRAVDGTCSWGVLPADPELVVPSAWVTAGGAVVLPEEAGAPGEVGVLRLDNTAVCADASARAMVTVPPREVSGALVVELRYRNTAVSGGAARGVELGIDGRSIVLPPTPARGNETRGVSHAVRGHGSTYELIVRPPLTVRSSCEATGEQILVDRLALVPALEGECAAPGSVVDPNFTASVADPYGWQYAATGSATAARVDVGGESGGAAGRVATAHACAEGAMTANVSWPREDTLPAPALRLWSSLGANTTLKVAATHGAPLALGLGVITQGSGTAMTDRFVCVPPWLQGVSARARFSVDSGYPSSCGGIVSRSATIDSLRFESQPSCGSDPYVLGGDFQFALNGAVIAPWQFTATGNGASMIREFIADPDGLDPTDRVLHLRNGGVCGVSTASTQVLVPELEGDEGAPALRFTYRTAVSSAAARDATVSVGNVSRTLERATGSMIPGTLCLPRAYAGRTAPITFRVAGPGSDTCGTAVYTDIWLDDVGMFFDPACPTE